MSLARLSTLATVPNTTPTPEPEAVASTSDGKTAHQLVMGQFWAKKVADRPQFYNPAHRAWSVLEPYFKTHDKGSLQAWGPARWVGQFHPSATPWFHDQRTVNLARDLCALPKRIRALLADVRDSDSTAKHERALTQHLESLRGVARTADVAQARTRLAHVWAIANSRSNLYTFASNIAGIAYNFHLFKTEGVQAL